MGVGAGARARHRRGDASTPARRRTARASRRRFAQIVADRLGRRPRAGRGHARRHRRRARRAWTPTARARWPWAARRSPARPRRWSEKAKEIVAHKLEAAPEDIELRDGQVLASRARPDKGMTLAEVARPRLHPRGQPARGHGAGPRGDRVLRPGELRVPVRGARRVVEVDPETGKVELVRYVAVDDCGPAINPNLIDGPDPRRHRPRDRPGALRAIAYDEDGQLRDGHVRRLRAARARRSCRRFETDRTETPSPVNSLGVKGVGEAGTIAASAAVTNAVIDALRPRRASTSSTCRSRPCGCGRRIQEKGGVTA